VTAARTPAGQCHPRHGPVPSPPRARTLRAWSILSVPPTQFFERKLHTSAQRVATLQTRCNATKALQHDARLLSCCASLGAGSGRVSSTRYWFVCLFVCLTRCGIGLFVCLFVCRDAVLRMNRSAPASSTHVNLADSQLVEYRSSGSDGCAALQRTIMPRCDHTQRQGNSYGTADGCAATRLRSAFA
jgi:hypothetical protein